MKRNKKRTVLALAAMLVMTLAVTVVSFSLAKLGGRKVQNADPGIGVASVTGNALTNIDYIIKAGSEAGSEPYKIVEIGSVRAGSAATNFETFFETFVTNGDFKEYVINGNKTLNDDAIIQAFLTNGTFKYDYFYSGDVTGDNAKALETIAQADLIYVSAEKPYSITNGNDFSEDLYNLLHVTAVGDYKPFIIDKPTSAGTSDDPSDSTNLTVNQMVSRYFVKMGSQYKAYYWDASLITGSDEAAANTFYQAGIGSGSNYTGINGRVRQNYWTNIKMDQTSQDQFRMADILIISGGNGFSDVMFNRTMAGATDTGLASIYEILSDSESQELTLGANQKLYKLEDTTPIKAHGYNDRYAITPDYARVTDITLADLELDTYADLDFTQYDMVILADECKDKVISADLYKKLVGVMYANVHMVYNKGLADASSGSTGGSAAVDTKSNYYELYCMVATNDDIARYPNVMVTEKAKLSIIASSKSAASCKGIADIINNGSFRGIGGPGSTSTAFTVLEIQPCYPVDTVIAQAKKQYYSVPSEVINGKTREQIGIDASTGTYNILDADGNSIDIKKAPEYYAWELSEAKIADALDMDVKQVKVVHMSSEEFATSKDAVLGNYDMVYIGGNTSALKDENSWMSLKAIHNDFNIASINDKSRLPVFTMYTHTGDMVRNELSVEEGPVPRGTPINAAPGHTNDETFVTLNGNDITYNGLEELQKFVDAGMPVLISTDVSIPYNVIKGSVNPYLQNRIDPDSYMYKFLAYCDGKNSVTWDFDKGVTEFVDNDGGRLGDTLTGKVEVFSGNAKTALKDLYTTNNKRPKLAVTSMPAVYNVYDSSTKTSSLTLNYKFDVTGSAKYDIYLYADYDKNSIFTDSEIIGQDSNTNTLSVNLATRDKYGDDYSGPVYWKLEIVDKDTGAAVSVSKLAYIQPESSSKKQVRVLQILPDKTIKQAYGGNSWVSLIFCTECQRAIEILDRNPGYEGSLLDGNAANLYDGKVGQDHLDANGCYKGIYTGKHEHKFGVVRYDSATAMDDWYYNYADDVSDMFDFDIDVMDSRAFEETSRSVQLDLRAYLTANYNGKAVEDLSDEDKEKLDADLLDLASTAMSAYEELLELDDVIEAEYPNKSFSDLTAGDMSGLETTLKSDPTYELALAEYNLKKFVLSVKDTGNANTNKAFNYIYNSGQYEDYVLFLGDMNNVNNTPAWHYGEYKKLYEAYAKVRDRKIELKEAYDKANRLAHYNNWLLGCYESVIIGPAESFCGDDIKEQAALDNLAGYIEGGGQMILFHDTLTKYSDAGSKNLTAMLIDYYGMDKNHAELDTDIVSGNKQVTETVQQIISNNETYNTSITVNGKQYNNLQLSAKKENISMQIKLDTDNYNSFNIQRTGRTLSAGELINFTITVYDKNNNLYTNGDITAVINGETYTGTTDASGIVKLKVKNYTEKEVTTTYTPNDAWYLPYKLKEGYTADEYTLPNLSYKAKDDTSRYYSWKNDMNNVFGKLNQTGARYYSPLYAYTDSLNLGHNDNEYYSPYRYATVDWHACTQNGYSASVASLGSNKASKTNKGIMTMYPFNLSDELNIAPTHAQAYALDLQNEDLSVWYTIGGGSNNKKASEMQAATPHDGTDNYFIYSVGNLNYCGAGHTKVTGQNKDNNDERMLYINVICNSVTNIPVTEIKAYDYSSTDDNKTNNIVKKQGSEYVYKIDENITRPDFSFEFKMGSGAVLKEINVYYELDGAIGLGTDDVLIKKYSPKEVEAGKLIKVPLNKTGGIDYDNLEIKPEYLTNGKYVYIVIEVVDTNGNKTRKRIKVEYKDKLYNLT